MTMLEKMARATYAKWIEDVRDLEPAWDALPESHRARMIDASRAALEAIREAGPMIVQVGMRANGFNWGVSRTTFTAMIDAMLAETPTSGENK